MVRGRGEELVGGARAQVGRGLVEDMVRCSEAPRGGRGACREREGTHAVWMAESFQRLGPTGRVNVQYSSTSAGLVREPSTTLPDASSTV